MRLQRGSLGPVFQKNPRGLLRGGLEDTEPGTARFWSRFLRKQVQRGPQWLCTARLAGRARCCAHWQEGCWAMQGGVRC